MSDASTILGHLDTVARERQRRAQAPDLAQRVQALKSYQQRRFAHTYDDLLGSPRYGSPLQSGLAEPLSTWNLTFSFGRK